MIMTFHPILGSVEIKIKIKINGLVSGPRHLALVPRKMSKPPGEDFHMCGRKEASQKSFDVRRRSLGIYSV